MDTALEKILNPVLSVLGLELVSLKFVSESGRKTLRIIIDKPDGITVEDCTQANRQIKAIIEAEFPEMSGQDLEISSPGLDRELITPEHYQRFLGSNVKISLHKAVDGQKNFKGNLLDISNHQIKLKTDEKTLDLLLEDIQKANLIPELRFKS